MDLFDPHIHMTSRITDDYERMALAGYRAVVEPAFWLGQPRTHAGTFLDYFRSLVEWEPKRAANYGIAHHACLAVNPREANDLALARAVLAELPRLLDHERVVAVGEVGYDDITDAEEEVLRAQAVLALERGLPILVHLPHRNKAEGARRTIAALSDVGFPPDRALIDHNTEETIELVRAWGAWAGHTVYPVTKLSPERAVNILDEFGTERMLVNSSADWGPSDALSVARTAHEMRRRAYPADGVRKVCFENPVEFFSKSGRLKL